MILLQLLLSLIFLVFTRFTTPVYIRSYLSEQMPIPYALSDSAVAITPEFLSDISGPRIYIIGGCVSDQICLLNRTSENRICRCPTVTNSCIFYSLSAESFYNCSHAPYLRYKAVAAKVGSYLFLAGGLDDRGNVVKAIDRLHLPSNSWSTGTELTYASLGSRKV